MEKPVRRKRTGTEWVPRKLAPMPACGQTAWMSELAIRARRAAFNRAIAESDAAAIAPLLTRDCVMVTGSDSAVIAGRNAQVKVWKSQFCVAGDPVIYVRMPERIVLSQTEPLAMEQGNWRGFEKTGGNDIANGTYCAKWRLIGGEWMIEAEVFVTL